MNNFPNLSSYMDRMNFWREHSNQEPLSFPLSYADAKDIVYNLEGDLSPENLHCDGEISREEAQQKYDYFQAVYHELSQCVDYIPDLDY